MALNDNKVTPAHLLLPLSLLAFVVFVFLAFQTSQILRDRDAMHEARGRQDKPLEDAQRVQAQLDALALGTLKLSQQGNKDAKTIIDRMKQLGITVNANAPVGGATSTPATDAAPVGTATAPKP